MASVIAARHGHAAESERLAAAVSAVASEYSLTAGMWSGEHELVPAGGGARYVWPVDGRAEVLVPGGYRTQEGDGAPLPAEYVPDPLPPELPRHVAALRTALDAQTVHPTLAAPLTALCARLQGDAYHGDVAGEIWLLLESGVPRDQWTTDDAARDALRWFIEHYSRIGWSTRQHSGWEPILPGDQILVTRQTPLRVRGNFRYWSIEDASGAAPTSAVRRLRYLRDTAGGCSPGFDAFRRLNLTWRPTAAVLSNSTARDPDSPNRLNSHVLHIEGAQSRTHYHPEASVGGGAAQKEFYFVLDPAAYGLRTPAGAVPRLFTYPDVTDWRRYEVTVLDPGVAAFIPPGTGHRGVDAFVNVVTIPGFKPGNEIYVDRLIAACDAGAPYNPLAA